MKSCLVVQKLLAGTVHRNDATSTHLRTKSFGTENRMLYPIDDKIQTIKQSVYSQVTT